MIDDGAIWVDHTQLADRGWTRSLIRKFLNRPDRFGTVNHWKNFYGMALYSIERVLLAEQRSDFIAAFEASVKRRKLSEPALSSIQEARANGNERYRVWLKNLTPLDLRLMVAAEQAAVAIDEARTAGYRTPHK